MTATPQPALVLTRSDIAGVMSPDDYLEAVERGFRALHEGRAESPPPLSIHAQDGAFHAKGAAMSLDRHYVAVKLNGNFPANRQRHGLPTIQGAILLCDGDNGTVLAIIDSIEVTLRRTAAATALAAKHLARSDSAIVTLCGCGEQAPVQLEALRAILPLERGYCWDRDTVRAHAFADSCSAAGFPMSVAESLRDALDRSDVVVACTSATEPFLDDGMVSPGTFVAAVGADNPSKSEIHPSLMARSLVVVDSLDQCAVMGDLHHALEAGAMTRDQVHAELGELACGLAPGRRGDSEITLFDSTGIAIQDVASAAMIYERCLASGAGHPVSLAL